jgi:hypothetical protein
MVDNLNKPLAGDDRLSILAVELGLAGAQVLQEPPFNFTQKQATLWLDKMLDRAKVNRGALLAMQAVKEIDGDPSTGSGYDKATGR